MSQGGLFGIGTSALQSYQRALQVTGHNIANAGTEGYSRQRLEFSASQPEYLGFGALGTGVQASNVTRVTDSFLQLRLETATSAESYQRTMLEFSSGLDDLLADADTGLAPALQGFFAAVQDVANDPTGTAARQQLISQGQTLVDRFARIEGQIDEQRGLVNDRVRLTVQEVNQLAAGIADLNEQIVAARGRGGASPNDLLDRRDALLSQLAERVGINTVSQEDGAVNVFIGRGQPLVVGSSTTELYTQVSSIDSERLDVVYDNGSARVPVTGYLSGGRLGALFDVRDAVLDPASNSLGRTAVALTESFNQVHQSNLDLQGLLGEAFFSRPEPRVSAADGNNANGAPALTISDAGALEVSDYELRYDGSQWALKRLADGATVASGAPGAPLQADGLEVDLSAIAGAASGDRYLLQPLRVAAGLEVRVSDPKAVAAGLPVAAEPATANAGSVTVHSLSVDDANDPDLTAPVQITFSGGAYQVAGSSIPPDPSGDTEITLNGWRVVLRGTPQDGDVVNVSGNSGGVGDNRGALALAALADQRVLGGGAATVAESYAALVADVGVKTQRARANADVQGRIVSEARSERESISGVNLDEEAANLLRYQQAYQAAAQVISVANSMFETLISTMRR